MPRRTIRTLFSAALAAALLACAPALAQPIYMFGLDHTPVGGATLGPNTAGTALIVSNIGSSGQDGVAIDLGPVTLEDYFFTTTLDGIGTPGMHAPGSFLRQQAFGSFAGGPRQTVSQLTSTVIGSLYNHTFDFTPSTTAPVLMQYYLGGPNGVLVGEETVLGGLVDGVQTAERVKITISIHHNPLRFDIDIDLGLGSNLRTASGNMLVADYISALVDAPAGFNGYSDVQHLAGGDYSSFSITNEAVVAVPEPSSIVLLAIGGLGLLVYGYRRRRMPMS